MLLTAVLIPSSEGGFTALNPETGNTPQGETVEESLANLQEATELYLQEFPLKTSGQPLVTTFQVTLNAHPAACLRRANYSCPRKARCRRRASTREPCSV